MRYGLSYEVVRFWVMCFWQCSLSADRSSRTSRTSLIELECRESLSILHPYQRFWPILCLAHTEGLVLCFLVRYFFPTDFCAPSLPAWWSRVSFWSPSLVAWINIDLLFHSVSQLLGLNVNLWHSDGVRCRSKPAWFSMFSYSTILLWQFLRCGWRSFNAFLDIFWSWFLVVFYILKPSQRS